MRLTVFSASMGVASRIISAIRDGRVISGAHRHYVLFAREHERLLRGRFTLPAKSSGLLPVISRCGDFTISDEARLFKHSFDKALNDQSPLPREIREIDG